MFRVVQRFDGFVSADTPYTGGQLVTRPLTFAGNRLVLNIDTGATGYAQVGLLDQDGRPIEGYGLDDCIYINGDFMDTEVEWLDKGKDVSALAGQPVQLVIRMRRHQTLHAAIRRSLKSRLIRGGRLLCFGEPQLVNRTVAVPREPRLLPPTCRPVRSDAFRLRLRPCRRSDRRYRASSARLRTKHLPSCSANTHFRGARAAMNAALRSNARRALSQTAEVLRPSLPATAECRSRLRAHR